MQEVKKDTQDHKAQVVFKESKDQLAQWEKMDQMVDMDHKELRDHKEYRDQEVTEDTQEKTVLRE